MDTKRDPRVDPRPGDVVLTTQDGTMCVTEVDDGRVYYCTDWEQPDQFMRLAQWVSYCAEVGAEIVKVADV